ncbi:MAG TPA: LytTR family DNA-binding domain-containing protein [Candidatus Dormibacteraeota bacterium]|nr:LytTR family DNA-binding domain-containing protein [Candidatus Dormibacteraeota bacterium]
MSPPPEDRLDVLVVDDEAPARDELAFLLRQQPAIGSIAQAADAELCLQLLSRERFDAVFLDIRMPRLDGLTLGRLIAHLAHPPQVVFVTAYEEHAVEAFGIEAVDYLLKPVRPERLGMTISRLLRARAGGSSPAPGPAVGDRLAVRASGGQFLLVPIPEIRVAVAQGEGSTVLTPRARYHVRWSLNELEERLRGHGFLRVHRAYLVNLNHVSSIESFFNGTYLLKLEGLVGLNVPVSRRHAAELKAAVRL